MSWSSVLRAKQLLARGYPQSGNTIKSSKMGVRSPARLAPTTQAVQRRPTGAVPPPPPSAVPFHNLLPSSPPLPSCSPPSEVLPTRTTALAPLVVLASPCAVLRATPLFRLARAAHRGDFVLPPTCDDVVC